VAVERDKSRQAVISSTQGEYISAVVNGFDDMLLTMEAAMIAGTMRKVGFAVVRSDGTYTLKGSEE
jgi:hypothetical protein